MGVNQLPVLSPLNQAASSYIPGPWLPSRSAHPWERKHAVTPTAQYERKPGLE